MNERLLNEDFDRAFLQALQGGVAARFAQQLGESELIRVAGNGANEIRIWLAMAGSNVRGDTRCGA